RVDSSKDKQHLGEDASKQGRIEAIDADEEITLVNDQDDVRMFDVSELHGDKVFIDKEVTKNEVNDEVQKLVKEVVENINTAKLIIDVAQLKKKDQIRLDEETALKLQAEFDEEAQRLAREGAQKELEANIALIETRDDVQAKIDVDYQLAKRLPVEDVDLLLLGDLKTMFEPPVEDVVWRKQQGYNDLEWKLYDSCGVHFLRMQSMYIYMLEEKKYP
nr:hypothetical protein [Tanacetum cinerariifolium]